MLTTPGVDRRTSGNAAHWRTMERASVRDVFLRYHESASSLLYLEERTRA